MVEILIPLIPKNGENIIERLKQGSNDIIVEKWTEFKKLVMNNLLISANEQNWKDIINNHYLDNDYTISILKENELDTHEIFILIFDINEKFYSIIIESNDPAIIGIKTDIINFNNLLQNTIDFFINYSSSIKVKPGSTASNILTLEQIKKICIGDSCGPVIGLINIIDDEINYFESTIENEVKDKSESIVLLEDPIQNVNKLTILNDLCDIKDNIIKNKPRPEEFDMFDRESILKITEFIEYFLMFVNKNKSAVENEVYIHFDRSDNSSYIKEVIQKDVQARRPSFLDGNLYSKEEFIDYYNQGNFIYTGEQMWKRSGLLGISMAKQIILELMNLDMLKYLENIQKLIEERLILAGNNERQNSKYIGIIKHISEINSLIEIQKKQLDEIIDIENKKSLPEQEKTLELYRNTLKMLIYNSATALYNDYFKNNLQNTVRNRDSDNIQQDDLEKKFRYEIRKNIESIPDINEPSDSSRMPLSPEKDDTLLRAFITYKTTQSGVRSSLLSWSALTGTRSYKKIQDLDQTASNKLKTISIHKNDNVENLTKKVKLFPDDKSISNELKNAKSVITNNRKEYLNKAKRFYINNAIDNVSIDWLLVKYDMQFKCYMSSIVDPQSSCTGIQQGQIDQITERMPNLPDLNQITFQIKTNEGAELLNYNIMLQNKQGGVSNNLSKGDIINSTMFLNKLGSTIQSKIIIKAGGKSGNNQLSCNMIGNEIIDNLIEVVQTGQNKSKEQTVYETCLKKTMGDFGQELEALIKGIPYFANDRPSSVRYMWLHKFFPRTTSWGGFFGGSSTNNNYKCVWIDRQGDVYWNQSTNSTHGPSTTIDSQSNVLIESITMNEEDFSTLLLLLTHDIIHDFYKFGLTVEKGFNKGDMDKETWGRAFSVGKIYNSNYFKCVPDSKTSANPLMSRQDSILTDYYQKWDTTKVKQVLDTIPEDKVLNGGVRGTNQFKLGINSDSRRQNRVQTKINRQKQERNKLTQGKRNDISLTRSGIPYQPQTEKNFENDYNETLQKLQFIFPTRVNQSETLNVVQMEDEGLSDDPCKLEKQQTMELEIEQRLTRSGTPYQQPYYPNIENVEKSEEMQMGDGYIKGGFIYKKKYNKYKRNKTKNKRKTKLNNIPKKYTKGLTYKDKKKQVKNIKTAKKAYKNKRYIDRPKLKSYKNKTSSWTDKFKIKYGDITKIKDISKATSIPEGALKAVLKKGRGAYYSSGSRPNQTAESWGRARMYSYIMGGPTRKYDREITKKYNVKF